MNRNTLIIDGDNLSIEDVYNVSHRNIHVEFPKKKAFSDKIKKSREIFEADMEKGYPIYGVTTGFGDSCDSQISPKKSESLQRTLVQYHGIGLGPDFGEEEGKAIVLIRLNSHLKGFSAIRMDLAVLMKELINHDIIPVIPQLGSVGASGDLTPLSYLAAVLMGERRVYYKGRIIKAKTALKKENLKPVRLKAKEGLAMMNGTSVMTALASLAWHKMNKLACISDFLTAATVEILHGNDIPFRSRISEIKNHSGQIKSAEFVYNIIRDSKRVRKYEELIDNIGVIENKDYKKHHIKIQDRYSLRCAPQINGVLRDTLDFTKVWIENELNSANDNPLIDYRENIIYNGGNFYGGHMTAACDFLRISLANTADLSDKQAALIIDGKFNNITENLIPQLYEDSPEKGLHYGFKAAQICISALSSEIQFLSNPVSIHSRPTEALNQDKVSLGTISSRKLTEAVDLAFLQFSVHLLAVLQAVDLIGLKDFSTFTKRIYKEVRKYSSFVDQDRPLDEDTKRVSEYLKQTDIFSTTYIKNISNSQ